MRAREGRGNVWRLRCGRRSRRQLEVEPGGDFFVSFFFVRYGALSSSALQRTFHHSRYAGYASAGQQTTVVPPPLLQRSRDKAVDCHA